MVAHTHPHSFSDPAAVREDEHFVSRRLGKLALGGALVGGAIILAPHVLPMVGIGSVGLAEQSFFALHPSVAGSGLAGAVNSVLSHVPVIGAQLAKGGLFNAAATAVTGIGGVMLGKAVSHHFDKPKQFPWGKAICYAALATSALIAMPSVLTGISAGLVYLGALVSSDPAMLSGVAGVMQKTIGSIGYYSEQLPGLSAAAATLPHLVTCGMSLLPAAFAWCIDHGEKKAKPQATQEKAAQTTGFREKLARPPLPQGFANRVIFQPNDQASMAR